MSPNDRDYSSHFGAECRSQRLTEKGDGRDGSVQHRVRGPGIDTSQSAGAVLEKSWLAQEALGYDVKPGKKTLCSEEMTGSEE